MGIREGPIDRAALMPHRKPAGDDRLDARLATAIGRLYFWGRINEAQFNAGTRYAQVALEYLASIDAPAPYGNGFDDLNEDEAFKRRLAYNQARHLMRTNESRRAVDKLTIYEEVPADDREWQHLRNGLSALAGIPANT